MATTTRAAIRRKAVHLARTRGFATADGSSVLTATSGSSSTLLDTANLPPTGAATSLYDLQWLYRPAANNAADRERIIAAGTYTGSTRTLGSITPTYTEAPLAGTDNGTYLILKDRPTLWNQAITEAFARECFFVRRSEFSPTSNTQLVYVLTAAPISLSDFTAPLTQIHGLEWHDENETAGEEQWKDFDNGIRTWEIIEDAGVFSLVLNAPFDTTMQVRINATIPYPALTDETTTSTVDVTYAAWATLLVMARWLGNDSDEWAMIGQAAIQEVRDRRRQALGRFAFRTVGRESQHGGAVSVGGRAGRGLLSGRIGRHGIGL